MRLFSSALSLLMLVGTHAQYNQAAAEAAAAQTAAALAAAGASGGPDAVDAILGAAASGSLADVIGAALSGSGTSLTDAIAAASSAAAALTAGGAGASESQIRTYYESLSALCSDKATLVGSLTSATFNGLPNTGLVELADYVCNGGFDAAAMAAWSVSGQQAASRVADSAGVAIPSAMCTPKGKAYLLAIGSYRGPAEVAADAVVECYCANYNSAEMFNDVIGGTVPSAVDAVFSQVPSMDVRSALCASTHCAGLLDYFSESAKTETIRARGQAASNAAALLGADAGSGSRAPAAIAPPPRGFGCSSIPVRGENKRTSVRMLAAGDVADFTRDVLAVIEQAVADLAGVDVSKVTATVTAASVQITTEIETVSAAEASEAEGAIAAMLSSETAASDFLSGRLEAAGKPPIVIEATPTVATETGFVAWWKSKDLSIEHLAAAGCGAVVGFFLIGGILFVLCRKKKGKVSSSN